MTPPAAVARGCRFRPGGLARGQATRGVVVFQIAPVIRCDFTASAITRRRARLVQVLQPERPAVGDEVRTTFDPLSGIA